MTLAFIFFDLQIVLINFFNEIPFPEQILTKPQAIQESLLSDLKYDYERRMDDYGKDEKQKIDHQQIDFQCIQND